MKACVTHSRASVRRHRTRNSGKAAASQLLPRALDRPQDTPSRSTPSTAWPDPDLSAARVEELCRRGELWDSKGSGSHREAGVEVVGWRTAEGERRSQKADEVSRSSWLYCLQVAEHQWIRWRVAFSLGCLSGPVSETGPTRLAVEKKLDLQLRPTAEARILLPDV